MFGFEGNLVPDGTDPAGAVKADSSASSQGAGSVRRSEALTTNVGAIITQILPNGNMVVEGRQEVRVNFEMRELIVAGIVRPEDVESDNTIESTKIAQARISYGGRGQITDVQQPRYGQQVLDVLLPF
jgi:flagellar L-ring protein precursor FlgH